MRERKGSMMIDVTRAVLSFLFLATDIELYCIVQRYEYMK